MGNCSGKDYTTKQLEPTNAPIKSTIDSTLKTKSNESIVQTEETKEEIVYDEYNFILMKNPTEEQYIELVKKYPSTLPKLKFQTGDICRVALQNGADLSFVHPKFITDDLEVIALKYNPKNIFNVKYDLRTCNQYLRLLDVDPTYVTSIDYHVFSKEDRNAILLKAVSKNGCLLGLIPTKYHTEELCKKAVSEGSEGIDECVHPNPQHTKILCDAIECDMYPLQFAALKTYDVCYLAVENLPKSFRYVPLEHHDELICRLAIELEPSNFKYIDKNRQTEEMCIFAVSQLSDNIRYLTNKFKTYNVLKHVQIMIYDIPFIPIELRQELILLQFEKEEFDYRLINYLHDRSEELYKKLVDISPQVQSYIYAQCPDLCNETYLNKWSKLSLDYNINTVIETNREFEK